jgi:hypothetical protein
MEVGNYINVPATLSPRRVVPNPWYEYPRGYLSDRLRVHENNIDNGGKHKKKRVQIKTQKQIHEISVYK